MKRNSSPFANLTFSDYIGIDNPEKYVDILLDDKVLPNWAVTALSRINIKNLYELLQLPIAEFYKCRSIGDNRLNQVIDSLKSINKNEIDLIAIRLYQQNNIPYDIAINREKIINGDFSYIVSSTKIKPKKKERYLRAAEELGNDLIKSCYYNPKSIIPIMSALSAFYNKNKTIALRRNVVNSLITSVPQQRKDKSIFNYIHIYGNSDYNLIYTLERVFRYNSCELNAEEINMLINDETDYSTTIDFLKWYEKTACADFNTRIKSALYSDSNDVFRKRKKIIELRSKRKTYKQICELLNLSLKSVKEAEKDILNKFYSDISSILIMLKLSADYDNKTQFTKNELIEEFGEQTDLVIYLYKHSKYSSIKFDTNSKCLIIGYDSFTTV